MTTAPTDTRPAQAARVAAYLTHHPGATAKQIDAACDVGSVTKVLSVMPALGYGLAKDRRSVQCLGGELTRFVRTYRLLHLPGRQPDLFNTNPPHAPATHTDNPRADRRGPALRPGQPAPRTMGTPGHGDQGRIPR